MEMKRLCSAHLSNIGCGNNLPFVGVGNKHTPLFIAGEVGMQGEHICATYDCTNRLDTLGNFLHAGQENQDTALLWCSVRYVLHHCGD
jgi:hypothetical protein